MPARLARKAKLASLPLGEILSPRVLAKGTQGGALQASETACRGPPQLPYLGLKGTDPADSEASGQRRSWLVSALDPGHSRSNIAAPLCFLVQSETTGMRGCWLIFGRR